MTGKKRKKVSGEEARAPCPLPIDASFFNEHEHGSYMECAPLALCSRWGSSGLLGAVSPKKAQSRLTQASGVGRPSSGSRRVALPIWTTRGSHLQMYPQPPTKQTTVRVCVCACVCVYVFICIHTHTHIYIYTHNKMCSPRIRSYLLA